MSEIKILMTGATGFIGSEVYLRLAKKIGFENIIIVGRKYPDPETSLIAKRLRHQGIEPGSVFKEIQFVTADFDDSQDLKTKMTMATEKHKLNVCVHMAAMIHAAKGASSKSQYRANVGVTEDVLSVAQENRFKRFVFTSSVVAFGGLKNPQIRTEKDFSQYDPMFNSLPYFHSKRLAHQAVLNPKNHLPKCPVSLICPGIVHGAFDGEKTSRSHLKKLVTGKLPLVPQGGGNFVSLDRVAEMHCEEVFRKGPEDSVRLAVEKNMNYYDYFELYLKIYNQIHSRSVSMPEFILPKSLGQGLGWTVAQLGKLRLKTPHLFDPIIASSMYLYFKSEFPLPETHGIENAIAESLNTQNGA